MQEYSVDWMLNVDNDDEQWRLFNLKWLGWNIIVAIGLHWRYDSSTAQSKLTAISVSETTTRAAGKGVGETERAVDRKQSIAWVSYWIRCQLTRMISVSDELTCSTMVPLAGVVESQSSLFRVKRFTHKNIFRGCLCVCRPIQEERG